MKRTLEQIGSDEHFDCCVLGAGPAGITTALQLGESGLKVALLEGGSDQYTRQSQDVYNGTMSGDAYKGLTATRLRFFGGTSNHWANWCRPLEEWDFVTKEATDTGWPIRKADLTPYLKSASRILNVPEVPRDRPFGNSGLNHADIVWAPPLWNLDEYFPVRFLDKYLSIINAHRNVHLFLNSNLTEFDTDGERVKAVVVKDWSSRQARIFARHYVLACGGIENNRILLWANRLTDGKLVRDDRTLGRYWMEHPNFTLGVAVLKKSVLEDTASSQKRRLFLAPSPETISKLGTLNCRLMINAVHQGIAEAVAEFPATSAKQREQVSQAAASGEYLPAVVRAVWEQQPNPDSRITLSEDQDELGMARTNLHWQKTELDRHTALATASLFKAYVESEKLGWVEFDHWLVNDGAFPLRDEMGGNHHMGGTRMASDPSHGIVDSTCKIFGQENLFVAGSSVFPSVGQCNPTLTIVQLALRLSDHLASLNRKH